MVLAFYSPKDSSNCGPPPRQVMGASSFFPTVKIIQRAVDKAQGLDPAEVAFLVSDVFGAQVFTHGFVHCGAS